MSFESREPRARALPERERGSQHPGRMTAAMRAGGAQSLARQRARVLRIGLVQDGRVREERTMGSAAQVTVGTREDNTFLLSGQTQPSTFRLFERSGGAYHLNLTPEMRGRVALEQGVFELEELLAGAQAVAGGARRIVLSEDARGRLVLGDTTFLFHFVEPCPPLPKAVLPVAVLRGGRGIDWNSTICGVLSFFVHFMLLGAVYSDWADPVIDDEVSTAGLLDSFQSLPKPPPVEDKLQPDDPRASVRDTSPEAPNAAPKTGTARGAPRRERTGAPRDADAAALSNQLAQMNASIVGSLTSQEAATSSVLRQGEVTWQGLDSAAASAAGIGPGSELAIPSGMGPVRGRVSSDLRDFGEKTLGADGPGRRENVKGPSASANIAPPSTSGGLVSDAARVVAGLRAGFRACYQRGLAENPDISGAIRLTIHVGAGGEVSSVAASPSGTLPATVVSCVRARAQAAQFQAPEGGAAVISVPVTFVKQ